VIGIWVINPNTTQAMTDKIEECARAVAGSGVIVIGITSQIGPESIESHYDEAPSVPGVLQAVQRGETRRHRGYVVACFGDPGLDTAREVAAGPVIGIGEAAMQAASHLGRGFSIVTTLSRTIVQSAGSRPRHRPECTQGRHRSVSRGDRGPPVRRRGAGLCGHGRRVL
jgi:allantoin racemase